MSFRNHALVATLTMLCTLSCAAPAHAEDDDVPRVMSKQEYAVAAGIPPILKVTKEARHDTLPSLRNAIVPKNTNVKRTNFEGPIPLPPGSTNQIDGAVQSRTSPTRKAPSALTSFDGVGNGFTGPQGTFTVQYAPPDTDGAVGATQYVSLVNTDLAVFDKTSGNVLYGPVATNTLWSGFGGICESDNDGDGVVVYDHVANRWLVSQFAVTNAGTAATPYLQCVAVSQTSDAMGAWNRYAFDYGAVFPDYPKMGVWPDAYYETFNMFDSSSNFVGANLCAYDRTNMLAGNAATQQCFQLSSAYGGVLPADVDGTTPPPAGAPNYLINYGTNSLNMWQFHVDWTTPANSTLTGPTNIAVSSFAPACGGGTCIKQPGTTRKLDSLADRMMFRLAYRNFGDHEALVASHSVTVNTYTGVRWYEIRSPGGTPTVYQQSTLAPDSSYRWMPSIAMDRAGDIALGYSVSNKASNIYPSVRYTGRTPSDVLSTMETEQSLFAGAASQSGNQGLTRWGDYSAMTVDPADDCTFWYTNEYIPTTGEFNWNTRIGSFKFPGCVAYKALVFTAQPVDVIQGNALTTIAVTVQDGVGATIADNSSADFTISACGGTIDLGTAAIVNGVATLAVPQRFYTVASGLTIAASGDALTATSVPFAVTANSDLAFSDGFDGCRL